MPKSILDKRNKDKIDIFLKKLEEGIPIKYATAIAGFDESTYFRAMQVAEEELEEGVDKSKHIEFYKSVKNAQAKFIAKNVENIQKAGTEKGVWQASAWLLERLDREHFGVKNKEPEQVENIEVLNDVPTIK